MCVVESRCGNNTTAQANSYAHRQTSVGARSQTRTHTHTRTHTDRHARQKNPKGTREDSHTLFFACVRMSQGGDEHIQRDATENSNFLRQLCGLGDKVFADGELILRNNESKI